MGCEMENIGVTHIGTVTAQGTDEERLAMLRVMGAGMVDDTQEGDLIIREAAIKWLAPFFLHPQADRLIASDRTLAVHEMAIETERMLRALPSVHPDTEELERWKAAAIQKDKLHAAALGVVKGLSADNAALQARVAELEAALAAQGRCRA